MPSMEMVLLTNGLWLAFLLGWCLLCFADAKGRRSRGEGE